MKYMCPTDCSGRDATCHSECLFYELRTAYNEYEKKKRHKETAVKVYQCDMRTRSMEAVKSHKTWKRRET